MAKASLILVLTTAVAVFAQEACYYPDRSFASTYRACPGPNGTTKAACCWADETGIDPCFNNGFCFSTGNGVLYRGACTDRDWNTQECVQQCNDINPGGQASLSFCNDRSLCCSSLDDDALNDCCSVKNTSSYFRWDAATITGPLNASTLYNVTDSKEAIPGAASAASTVTMAASSNDSSPSQGALIGLGVGLGVPLIIALATIGWLFLALRKERHRTDRTHSDKSPPYPPSPMENVQPQQEKFAPNPGYAYAQAPSPPMFMQQRPPVPAELAHEGAMVEAEGDNEQK